MNSLMLQNLLVTIVVFWCFDQGQALSCGACDRTRCRSQSALKCRGGYARDVCGCCEECAKLEGERCGGMWNMGGRCDTGLRCEPGKAFGLGKCRKDIDLWQNLPRCPKGLETPSFGQPCDRMRSLFCDQDCNNCCVHDLTCNPNPKIYKCRIMYNRLLAKIYDDGLEANTFPRRKLWEGRSKRELNDDEDQRLSLDFQ